MSLVIVVIRRLDKLKVPVTGGYCNKEFQGQRAFSFMAPRLEQSPFL